MNKKQLQVKILTPDNTLYEGPVVAIAAINDSGKFSILPGHTNFISVIHDSITAYLPDRTEQVWPIEKGVISCNDNKVEIYIEKIATD